MDSHHYHLQYLLYSLALHRFLAQRLKGYDYDSHFGGCYYLFIRGMSAQNLDFNGIYFSKPKRKVIEQLDDLFAGSKGDGAPDSDEIISPEQLGLFGE